MKIHNRTIACDELLGLCLVLVAIVMTIGGVK